MFITLQTIQRHMRVKSKRVLVESKCYGYLTWKRKIYRVKAIQVQKSIVFDIKLALLLYNFCKKQGLIFIVRPVWITEFNGTINEPRVFQTLREAAPNLLLFF